MLILSDTVSYHYFYSDDPLSTIPKSVFQKFYIISQMKIDVTAAQVHWHSAPHGVHLLPAVIKMAHSLIIHHNYKL